jgi:hypothetical protein
LGEFSTFVLRPFNFFADKVANIIRQVSKEHFERLGLRMPVEYLTEKTITLFQLMMRCPCIIICGPFEQWQVDGCQDLSESIFEDDDRR